MPRAREQMQRRLLALQEKSIDTVEQIFAACDDDKVRLAAAVAVFDRTGLGPKSTVDVHQHADVKHLTTEQIAAELETMAKSARALSASSPNVNPDRGPATHSTRTH